jgi:Predicted xylanase/chitin deacetylase
MQASRICLALCLAALALPAMAKQKFSWPEGRKAAVSLAYDDALDSQLDNAVPQLQKYGLKGSFYIVPGREPVRARMEEWREVARMGHELGNHSITHPCSAHGPGREWVPAHQDLDRMSLAQIKEQVEVADVFLQALDGYAGPRTYTAPCGDRKVADGDYIAAVADRFLGIKLVGGDVVPDMFALDPAAVPAAVPSDVTGKQLIALVEEAGRKGTMVGFTFHGVGGDYLSVSKEAHEELLAFLAANRDKYWTATFREQMQWVRQQQEAARGGRKAGR